MGGFGSGYHAWRRLPRNLVERAWVLDVSALDPISKVEGTIASGQNTLMALATGETLELRFSANLIDPANPHFELTFEAGGSWQHQVISLAVTRPTYGGARYWFLCPISGARTRCLYLPGGATEFASRAVHGLSYRSQGENAFWRDVRRVQKIRVRLGGDPAIYVSFPPRPRGMHRRRYEQLKEAASKIEAEAIEKLGPARLAGRDQQTP